MSRTRTVATPAWVKVSLSSALLLASSWWLADRHDRHGNEARLSAVASRIAGRAVHVSCPGPIGRLSKWDTVEGSVRFAADGTPADVTDLRAGPCEELDALAEGRREYALACAMRGGGCREAELLARSVDVVTHESWHLQGVIDEGQTECRSLQTMARSAQQLGATAQEGAALARLQLATGYELLPGRYRSADCRDGGPLDLRPDDPTFPAGHSCTPCLLTPPPLAEATAPTTDAAHVSSATDGAAPISEPATRRPCRPGSARAGSRAPSP